VSYEQQGQMSHHNLDPEFAKNLWQQDGPYISL
jgi:hypothetical protein